MAYHQTPNYNSSEPLYPTFQNESVPSHQTSPQHHQFLDQFFSQSIPQQVSYQPQYFNHQMIYQPQPQPQQYLYQPLIPQNSSNFNNMESKTESEIVESFNKLKMRILLWTVIVCSLYRIIDCEIALFAYEIRELNFSHEYIEFIVLLVYMTFSTIELIAFVLIFRIKVSRGNCKNKDLKTVGVLVLVLTIVEILIIIGDTVLYGIRISEHESQWNYLELRFMDSFLFVVPKIILLIFSFSKLPIENLKQSQITSNESINQHPSNHYQETKTN